MGHAQLGHNVGEFKESVPPHRWQEAIGRLWDGDEPTPVDEEPFDGMDRVSSIDYDWPEWPAQEMLDWMPKDIQERFGSIGNSMVSGPSLGIDPASESEVVAALEEAGYIRIRDDDLIERANAH